MKAKSLYQKLVDSHTIATLDEQNVLLFCDLHLLTVHSPRGDSAFTLSARHRRMFLEGLDMIGVSLTYKSEIAAFAERHWALEL